MKNNFDKLKKELEKKIANFEDENGQDYNFCLGQNDDLVHSMKMKGEVFKNIELDEEFENADLLDYLGYERIISCKKNGNK